MLPWYINTNHLKLRIKKICKFWLFSSVLEQIKIMTENNYTEKNIDDLNNICDECKEEDESVTQNLILTGFKICKSCRVSKTIFPI